ncbi:hypothetical protein DLAC_06695 [Tieghemostelium lacteum]|uniref:Gamma-secretase subunit PEN-2 n=1 Tax=Tieghemostelium lacteum TaxID=361077 RepID=A0A151ZFF0_TIELA|nr:hypothetical protein DLAC_06695 [Tieghemostelium lacteum]|eukprot:KYQ92696.1 hypothetical protein DLAC_06695 [Tieghemostelium lacteum]
MLIPEDDKLDEQKLKGIAKKLWIAGFFLLPWVWLINVLFFIPYRKEINNDTKWYLKFSLVGFFVYTGIFMTWMGIYLVNRNKWGTFGDEISVVIPFG